MRPPDTRRARCCRYRMIRRVHALEPLDIRVAPVGPGRTGVRNSAGTSFLTLWIARREYEVVTLAFWLVRRICRMRLAMSSRSSPAQQRKRSTSDMETRSVSATTGEQRSRNVAIPDGWLSAERHSTPL